MPTPFLSWQSKIVINKIYVWQSSLQPPDGKGQMMDLESRSISYSQNKQATVIQQINMTANENLLESPIYNVSYFDPRSISIYNINYTDELSCMGFGGRNNISGKGCASAIKASVNVIETQSNSTGTINIVNKNISPTRWNIENDGDSYIVDMELWWGGVEFGENIPNNTGASSFGLTSDAQAAGAATISLTLMIDSFTGGEFNGYQGNGIGNLALLQQWRKEGTTEEGISRMFKRQLTDIMTNMVTPTSQAKIISLIQLMVDKTCHDLYYATQFYIAIIGIIMLCVLLINIIIDKNDKKAKIVVPLTIKQIALYMDLGRVIISMYMSVNNKDIKARSMKSSDWEMNRKSSEDYIFKIV
ncbi:19954_t:CDS:2 [Cetraspora pellucida]|uniref:19954_t:CDS:1 n=1 Tax=Cetraspora pellucida TaxID=1433469 RepID=A0A9N9HYM1_9GLOM|nr:19954_t:CDS:2 [Cetraspora pellucida]